MNPIATLYDTLTAYQHTGALRAAVELDLFTAIAEGDATVEALVARTGAAPRGVRGLCDALAAMGFLTKNGDRYALPADVAPMLDGRSPTCVARAARFIANPALWQAFGDLAAAVRRGGTTWQGEGSVDPDNPMWVEFARAMAPTAQLTATLLADALGRPDRDRIAILDVAAGHGFYGITLAGRHPGTHVTALDWASVLAVAEENARAAGVGDRLRLLPGSAFEVDWGGPYDVVLLTNFLHHFDPPTCETIFRRAHAALAPGGRCVTVEFVPDEDRVAPAPAACFTLVMLVTTRGGDVYTFSEYDRMARNAGFARSELLELPPAPQRAIVSYRASGLGGAAVS
jgi:SAM-dependent methyltransferase